MKITHAPLVEQSITAEYYAERLKSAYITVCEDFKQPGTISTTDLEPLWHLVETMALARLFKVERALYDDIDSKIEAMGRKNVIISALKCFLTPGLRVYLRAIHAGDVHPQDVILLYVRMCAALDWMWDNTCILTTECTAIYDKLYELRDFVLEHRLVVLQLLERDPELRSFMRCMLTNIQPGFMPITCNELLP